MESDKVKKIVRKGYAKIAKKGSSCDCCGSVTMSKEIGKKIGYSEKELESVPEGSNLGLGCGNPVALASLKEGDFVLDLGSGAGFDCFLAANRVGEKGMVIGVDMTPEMIDKARGNVRKSKHKNVEFRLGEIENLPVADNTVDVVISNCVINLSPDKKQVFNEAFRVLKKGGRLMVSDIVLLKQLPEAIRSNMKAYVSCVSGAVTKDTYLDLIRQAGFQEVKIHEEKIFPFEMMFDDPTAKNIVENLKIPAAELKEMMSSIASVKVSGVKS